MTTNRTTAAIALLNCLALAACSSEKASPSVDAGPEDPSTTEAVLVTLPDPLPPYGGAGDCVAPMAEVISKTSQPKDALTVHQGALYYLWNGGAVVQKLAPPFTGTPTAAFELRDMWSIASDGERLITAGNDGVHAILSLSTSRVLSPAAAVVSGPDALYLYSPRVKGRSDLFRLAGDAPERLASVDNFVQNVAASQKALYWLESVPATEARSSAPGEAVRRIAKVPTSGGVTELPVEPFLAGDVLAANASGVFAARKVSASDGGRAMDELVTVSAAGGAIEGLAGPLRLTQLHARGEELLVASGETDGCLYRWNTEAKRLEAISKMAGRIQAIATDRDSDAVFLGSDNGEIARVTIAR